MPSFYVYSMFIAHQVFSFVILQQLILIRLNENINQEHKVIKGVENNVIQLANKCAITL